ncbi:sigma-54 interaction domain-containing protein [Paenibacillus sp. GCM10023252]|uniref:sigma-54 interaction domain-containing protein n=1 Tax=Paenibacillus sp. GCM10023252 TaxID=3252649 RepID=UPI0036158AB9
MNQEDSAGLHRLLLYYKEMANKLSEGIHIIDAQAITVVYNQKMIEMESMLAEDVLGKPLHQVFHFPEGQESTLLLVLRLQRPILGVRQTYYNRNGKRITTLNNTYPIMEGNVLVGAMEIASDVTKMMKMVQGNLLRQGAGSGAGGGSAYYTFDQIVGQSPLLAEVIQNAKRAARTSSSVLVVGETGTGKELFVQSIHQASSRGEQPFISQNCAALPDTLIESLLFGTVPGAFTGATERKGLFEQAEGGTLFLDEVNSLSMPLQAKLLRALQEKVIRRIGDTKERPINIRIIAALNEDPIRAVEGGRLRKDLYYRLGVVTLFVPPLRERGQDVLLLAKTFIAQFNSAFDMNVQGISDEVTSFLQQHQWQGNVRELQHLIEGAMNLMEDEPIMEMRHLPIYETSRMAKLGEMRPLHEHQQADALAAQSARDAKHALASSAAAASPGTLRARVDAFEQRCIEDAVARNNGNVSKAATELGLSRQSLQYRLRKRK